MTKGGDPIARTTTTRRKTLPTARKVESVLYLLGGGWIGWLLTDDLWLPALLLALPLLALIFAPRAVAD